MRAAVNSLFLTLPMLAAALPNSSQAQTPVGDYHQHIFSAQDLQLAGPQSGLQPLDARDVVALLDAAGIRQATLLSLAYQFGKPGREADDEAGAVRR
jgi:hypothetical protein